MRKSRIFYIHSCSPSTTGISLLTKSTENTPVDEEDQCLELQTSYRSNELLDSLEI